MTSNLELWRFFMKDMTSPNSYIDFSFYYLISAALQRRVWLGSENLPIFPNQYTILVGEPGVGKGLVIKPVEKILRHFKIKTSPPTNVASNIPKGAIEAEGLEATELANNLLEQLGINTKFRPREEPLVIPVAANSTTYEALTHAIGASVRRYNYSIIDPQTTNIIKRTYSHCSLAFCLEEISSLFRKHTEDVVNFLLQAYDCGDYERDTKTQGKTIIKKCCLNILGGTTPSFMQSTFNDKLLNEGFASRTFFIYETENRFQRFFMSDFTEEQLAARRKIIEHVEKLTQIYGEVTYTQEARNFLQKWWEEEHVIKRPNESLKLNAYYARKNQHVPKMALAIHFADNTTMEINKTECEMALKLLEYVENKMHLALTTSGHNTLGLISRRIVVYIKNTGPKTFDELLLEFFDDLKQSELADTLSFLIQTKQIKKELVDLGTRKQSKFVLYNRPETNLLPIL